MKVHPKISRFINLINNSGLIELTANDKQVLAILKDNGATQTEAGITIHFAFGISLGDAEKIVYPSKVWERESLEDIAYQTFLYMNYNPSDPDYSYDDNKVKFTLFSKDKK